MIAQTQEIKLIAAHYDDQDAIFRDIRHALHVAFLMEILPATQKSQMQALIDKLNEMAGVITIRERGLINFSGLNALEIRGQCAMVRAMVDDRLLEPEALAIKARFGHKLTKSIGMLGVARYIEPLISRTSVSAGATQAIVCSLYVKKTEKPFFTTRAIAEHYSVSQRTVCNDMQIVRGHVEALENSGMGRMSQI